MADFRELFEQVSAPLHDVSEEMLTVAFINALKEEIRAEIRLHPPLTLSGLMDLAQRVEDRNEALLQAQNPHSAHNLHQSFHGLRAPSSAVSHPVSY